ncbi:MAG TPA: PQQ-binding-like beta-propeller repeat protein [Gemmataceae bacterium]|nr:PQQ-binding-like beta-propeller repeat protein [Gemmataceae bacterium]
MRSASATSAVLVGCGLLLAASSLRAQDWPQWRGPNRDARVTGFKAPREWPKELTKKWKVKVGEGVATPALVGDRLYVFVREGGDEVIRCLDAGNGKELWQDKYPAKAPTRPGSGFNNEFVGPRASPAVADGKVVTYGASGILSCYDAASGKRLWRKDDFKGSWPRFFTSSSPMIVGGLVIAQLGGEGKGDGGMIAYDLATGEEKWKWTGDGTAYASPVLLAADGVKAVIAEAAHNVVAVNARDGKLLWKTSLVAQRMSYNACTPMVVEGQTVIWSGSGQGTKAVRLEKKGDELAAKELWTNPESVQFNTPVVKDGFVYGISNRNQLFCINARDGKTAWTRPLGAGGGGRRGPSGYGSVVDAGPVLFALTPSAELVVFATGGKEFKEVAKYKVADSQTYAYPVVSGNRVFVKDRDSLTLWTIE